MAKKEEGQDRSVLPLSEGTMDFSVVGVGASAGGLEALQEFFKNTPDDPGVAFVVIQHLSPDYKSLMDELLARHTQMDIHRVKDGTGLKANHIYLIPPRKNMTIFRGKLYLTEQEPSRMVNMPIDIFLRSLAQDQGKNAIGVILSGTGSDGTLGIRAIKEHGGMVIAQDDRSAKFDGMPRSSISTGMVDYILTPGEMPEALINYIKHPFIQKTEKIENQITRDEDYLSKIIMIIRDTTGIDFSNYKESTVIRRLEKRISINRYDTIEDYVHFISHNKREVNILYRELLIGVTRFFRDGEAFEKLQEVVIPKLLEKDRKRQPLRIWSIGCSTGEEAYSLAILIKEYMDINNISPEVKLFATDIDKDSIGFAGAGLYPESIVSDVSPEYLSKYFTRKEEGYLVNESIRRMVIFAPHNILKDPPFSRMDLIVCRNMLIYLNNEVQQKILSMFYLSLNKEGYLFLGSSESVGEASSGFAAVDTRNKIYKHQPGYKPPVNELYRVPTIQKKRRELKNVGSYLPQNTAQPPRLEDIFDELLGQFVPPSVIVDENYNVVHIIHNVNAFVKLPVGQVSLNLLNMLPDELATMVSSILRRAGKHQQRIIYENIRLKEFDHQSINLSGRRLDDRKNKEMYFMISFQQKEDDQGEPQGVQEVERVDVDNQYQERIHELEKELQFTRENLQATVEELETSNEELQSSNEELIASNEELQSTNEELQSVNEELYTVNAEHQEKIDELTQLNNDMNNLLKNTYIGTLFLDSRLRIRKLTEVASQITNIRESDVGRPIDHIALDHLYDGFVHDIEQVLENLNPKEGEVRDKKGNWYLVRMLPYRTAENAVNGIIITFIEISDLKHSQNQVETLNSRLEEAMKMGDLAWWEWDLHKDVIRFGEKKATMLGYTPQQMRGGYKVWTDLLHPDDYEAANQAMRDHLEGKNPFYEISYRLRHYDGHYIWYKDKGGIVKRDSEGKPYKLAGIVLNITNEKQMEAEKEKTYQLIYQTLDHNPVASTVVNAQGQITFANKKAEQVLGITQKQIRKRDFDDLKWEITDLNGKSIPSDQLPFSKVMNTGEPVHGYHHYIKLPDQASRLLSINGAPMLKPDGETHGVVFTLEDITRSFEMEKQKRMWKHSVDALEEGLVLLDEQYNILQYNQAFMEIVGMEGQDANDKKLFELVHGTDHPPERCATCRALAEQRKTADQIREPYLNKELKVSIHPVYDDQGKFEFAIYTLEEVKQTPDKEI